MSNAPRSARAAIPLRGLVDEKFWRFILVGCSNFLVSFFVFRLLLLTPVTFAAKATVSQLVSYAAGMLWSFVLNRRLTLKSSDAALPQMTRFLGLQVVLALISAALIGVCVDVLALPAARSWLAVMTVITVVNFLISKSWVFK